MIHVIATIQVKPGRRDDFLAEFHRIVPEVHAEQGCLDYGPAVDIATDIGAQQLAGVDCVVIIERWESLESLKDHLQAPHMDVYRGRVKDIVMNAKLQILQPAG